MNWKLIRIIDAYVGIPILFWISLTQRFKRQRQITSATDINKILLIKFWGVGNIFLMLPTLQALRQNFPNARLDFLTLENNREALSCTGSADLIETISTESPFKFISTWRKAVSRLRRNDYDIVIDFEQFARFSALLTHQIGGAETIGFKTAAQHRHLLFSRAVSYDNTVHVTRSFFSLAEAAGVSAPFSPVVDLPDLPRLRSHGIELLQHSQISTDRLIVLMHIGTSSNFRERRWPPEHFAELADRLVERHDAAILFTGLAEESHLIRETMNRMHHASAARDMAGALPFQDFFSLIAVADLVVSADTAAVHLASAAGTAVLGLYGPNTPLLYGPWGTCGIAIHKQLDCSPCITNFNAKIHTCRHPSGPGHCMSVITADEVLAAIESHFFDASSRCHLQKQTRRA